MNARARNFLAANELSPVVYGSVAENGVVYRLADGKMFNLSMIEARQAPHPRWAFAEAQMNVPALAEHDRDNAATLERVLREAQA